MSGYHQQQLEKAKRVDAKLYDAMTRLCFNQDIVCLRNMKRALEIHSSLNTAEENQRLADVTYYLRNRHKLTRVNAGRA